MSPHLHEHEFVQMGLIYFFYLALATLAAQPLGHSSNRGMGQAAPNQATAARGNRSQCLLPPKSILSHPFFEKILFTKTESIQLGHRHKIIFE